MPCGLFDKKTGRPEAVASAALSVITEGDEATLGEAFEYIPPARRGSRRASNPNHGTRNEQNDANDGRRHTYRRDPALRRLARGGIPRPHRGEAAAEWLLGPDGWTMPVCI